MNITKMQEIEQQVRDGNSDTVFTTTLSNSTHIRRRALLAKGRPDSNR